MFTLKSSETITRTPVRTIKVLGELVKVLKVYKRSFPAIVENYCEWEYNGKTFSDKVN